MANRFWVGGTATWDGTAGSKWATTSGGAGGAAVPTTSDDVFFDAASGAVTVTTSGTVSSHNINFTGFTGTINNNSPWTFTGSVVLDIGMTVTSLFPSFTGTTSETFTSNGVSIKGLNVTGTGTMTLLDNLSINGTGANFSISNGTFDANVFNVTNSSVFTSLGTNTRTINMGSGTWTLLGFRLSGSNITLNSSTSSLKLTGSLSSDDTFDGLSKTFNNVWFANTGVGSIAITGSNTFNDLKIEPGTTLKFTGSTTQTVTTLTSIGTSGSPIVLTQSGGGTILTYTIVNGGTGYTNFNSIIISGGNNGAGGFAGVTGGAITSIPFGFTGGMGYQAGVTYNVSGGSGSGAQIRADTVTPYIWTISDSSGTNATQYTTISYSTASGGAVFNAFTSLGNVDGGNNTGWIFSSGSSTGEEYTIYFN